MVEPFQNDPSFGLPPEIPTGTSTPVPDEVVVTPPPVVNNTILPEHKHAATPRQTLIDVLGPEAVSTSPNTPTFQPIHTDIPKPAPAPAPAQEQTLPTIEEPPFERAVPLKTVSFGIPTEQTQPKPPVEEKPTVSQPVTPPTQNTPPQTPPTTAVSEAIRRASIRTLESDAAETIHSQNLSVSSIALAQQQKESERAVRDILPEEKSGTIPWVLGGVGLAVLGVIVVTVAYLMQTQASDAPVTVTPANALIPGVEETTLDVTDMTRTKLSQTLSALPSAYAQKSGISLVRLVTYVEQTDTDGKVMRVVQDMLPEDFFQTLSARNTDRLERSLGKLTYFGIVSKGGKVSPFLAFEVVSYESAFAGLLEWEPALPEDISFIVRAPASLPPPPAPILPPVSTTTLGTASIPTSQGVGTSTSSPKSVGATLAPQPTVVRVTSSAVPIFKDLSVKNKDTRAYIGEDGMVRILYSFLSQKLLIVAQDEETLTAIIDYISTARFSG
ncbi:MAG: hypothetical protein NUW02_00995 [Candidatus Campbellbacteria bacterium]|nr:hypothetical protein [Candidatus Campbellbacteria bacterium]